MYIDPGSGTFLWQAVLFAVSGIIFSLRQSLRQLMMRVTRKRKDDGAAG